MTTEQDDLGAALARASGSRDAAAALGVPVGAVARRVRTLRPDLAARWAELCAADRPGPRMGYSTRAEAEAIVARAAASAPPDPARPQRENVARLLVAASAARGSMNLPRGWVGAAMRALAEAGCPTPTPATLRWYRSRLVDEPLAFEDVEGVDEAALAELADRAYR